MEAPLRSKGDTESPRVIKWRTSTCKATRRLPRCPGREQSLCFTRSMAISTRCSLKWWTCRSRVTRARDQGKVVWRGVGYARPIRARRGFCEKEYLTRDALCSAKRASTYAICAAMQCTRPFKTASLFDSLRFVVKFVGEREMLSECQIMLSAEL